MKTRGSFPWRDSSSPRIGFSRGPGDGPLVGGEGGVGGRGGDGPRGGKGDRSGADRGDIVSVGGGKVLDSSFGVIAGDSTGSSFIGVGSCVFTNFRLYGDLICHGLVGSGVGSARNMRRRQSSVQYRSSGVDHHGLSSPFIGAAGSSRTAC